MTERDRPTRAPFGDEPDDDRHLRELERLEVACMRALFVADATGSPAEPARFNPYLAPADVKALADVYFRVTESQRAILSARLANSAPTERANAGPVFDFTDEQLEELGRTYAKASSDSRWPMEDAHERPSYRRQSKQRSGQHRPPNPTRKERLVEKRPCARPDGS